MVYRTKKIEKIFSAKDLRRKQLAKLPFEKKMIWRIRSKGRGQISIG